MNFNVYNPVPPVCILVLCHIEGMQELEEHCCHGGLFGFAVILMLARELTVTAGTFALAATDV